MVEERGRRKRENEDTERRREMSEMREGLEREGREEEERGQTKLLSHSQSPSGQSLESGQLQPRHQGVFSWDPQGCLVLTAHVTYMATVPDVQSNILRNVSSTAF